MVQKNRNEVNAEKAEALLESFKKICAEAGLKVTHQRLEIFRILAQSADHPSVEQIFERVKVRVPTIALDTVYRSLASLERHGVLVRVGLDTRTRYDPNTTQHHHFVCMVCKQIEDFYWPVFDQMKLPARKPAWGRIDSRHVEIRGICSGCSKKAGKQG